MSPPTIELLGLPVRDPVSTLTNLFLALECVVFAWGLAADRDEESRLWALFFGTLGFAILAGVFKHGVPDGPLESLRSAGHYLSNVGTAASVTLLAGMRVGRHTGRGPERRWLTGVLVAGLVGFSGLTLRWPSFGLVALHGTLLLVPIMGLELRAWRRGSAAGGWLLSGLLVSCLTGVVYAWAPRVNVWIDHIDVSHALLAVSFALLLRGADLEEVAWTA